LAFRFVSEIHIAYIWTGADLGADYSWTGGGRISYGMVDERWWAPSFRVTAEFLDHASTRSWMTSWRSESKGLILYPSIELFGAFEFGLGVFLGRKTFKSWSTSSSSRDTLVTEHVNVSLTTSYGLGFSVPVIAAFRVSAHIHWFGEFESKSNHSYLPVTLSFGIAKRF
jgi:hypothetical protein